VLVASLAVTAVGCDAAPLPGPGELPTTSDETLGEAEEALLLRSRLRTLTSACDADPGVDSRRSLFVPDVASDPRASCSGASPGSCGPWSFGYLMAGLAQSMDHETVSNFVEAWLVTWRQPQVINGQAVEARPLVDERILDGWRRTPEGWLRFDDAPFKLLTVVTRFDLRDDEHYGGTDTAGQGRFIFGQYGRDAQGDLTPAKALQFNLIYEFNVPAVGCQTKLDWARRIVGLSTLDNPVAHRAALQTMTDDFAGFDVAAANLSQLRTNEVELGALVEGTTQLFLPWQLREFRLACAEPNGDACDRWALPTVTTKQSIARDMMAPENRDALWEWVSLYADDIAAGREFEIPETFVDSSGEEHAFLAAFDESYTNRGGILPLTPQRDPQTGELIPYAATCRVANSTCGGCHRKVDEGCDNFDEEGRRNPLATPDLRTGFLMVSHLRPPTGAPFGFTKLSPFLTEKAIPERQRDLCEFVARECKVRDVSSFITEHSTAH
jgi:hypothetical protein